MCVLKRCGFVLYFIFLPHHAEPTLPAAAAVCYYALIFCVHVSAHCWCGTFPLAVISLAWSVSCINFCVKCPRRTALARLSTPIYPGPVPRAHAHNAPPARGWITKLQSSHATAKMHARGRRTPARSFSLAAGTHWMCTFYLRSFLKSCRALLVPRWDFLQIILYAHICDVRTVHCTPLFAHVHILWSRISQDLRASLEWAFESNFCSRLNLIMRIWKCT
jgi:hypothetical protein